MKQYLDLLQNILDNGVEKESGRANMPNTIGISHGVIQMDLANGFPLLTTKKMHLKGIIHELLWILRGDTNIKYLVDNNVNIWNGDAYRWYLKFANESGYKKHKKFNTQDEFIEAIKSNNHDIIKEPSIFNLSNGGYTLGDLGKVYGQQWRNQHGVDQVKDVIEGLKNNPYSRYHIIDGWNKADFLEMALPPCHLLYQFIVRPLTQEEMINYHITLPGDISLDEEELKKYFEEHVPKFYLDLNMYQRSCDSALGVPYNLATMALLLEIFSKASNMIAGIATWIGGDTHIYVNHIETIKEQIKRTPYKLPNVKILKDIKTLEDILKLTISDFELHDYQSHEKINYELFVGLKKKL